MLLSSQAGLADQASALHLVAVCKFEANHAPHGPQHVGSRLDPLVGVDLHSSSPHRKVAFDVFYAPQLIFFLATGTNDAIDADDSLAECSLHQFFALFAAAPQFQPQPNGGIVDLYKSIGSDLFQAISRFAFGDGQSRK